MNGPAALNFEASILQEQQNIVKLALSTSSSSIASNHPNFLPQRGPNGWATSKLPAVGSTLVMSPMPIANVHRTLREQISSSFVTLYHRAVLDVSNPQGSRSSATNRPEEARTSSCPNNARLPILLFRNSSLYRRPPGSTGHPTKIRTPTHSPPHRSQAPRVDQIGRL